MNALWDRRTFIKTGATAGIASLGFRKGLQGMEPNDSNATMDSLMRRLAREQSAFFLQPFSFSWWLRGGEPGSPSDNLTLEGERGSVKATYIRVRFDSSRPSHQHAETFAGVIHRDSAAAILKQLFEGPLFRSTLPEENIGQMRDGRKESWLFHNAKIRCDKTLHEPFPSSLEPLRSSCEKTAENVRQVYAAQTSR